MPDKETMFSTICPRCGERMIPVDENARGMRDLPEGVEKFVCQECHGYFVG
jgi:predicted RNA-binding Zn-ribbon protein involved in translation (DUF1610 family)